MKQINIKHNYILPISSSLAKKCCSSLLLKTTVRSSRSQMFFKIVVLKNFRNLHRKTPLLEKLYEKETTTQVFFFEYCKIFKKSLFYRVSAVVASGHLHCFLSLIFLSFSSSSFRSSHRRCSIKKLFYSFAILTGKHLCLSLFLIKFRVEDLQHLLKRDSNTGVFL